MSHHTKHAHKHSTRQRHAAEHRESAAHEQPPDDRPEGGADERRPTAGVVHRDGGRTVTVTIPVDTIAGVAVEAVKLPITAAQRILPAKGGLPLYLGVGALGVAGVLDWPVAAGIGIGYAVLRKGGDLRPPPSHREDTAHGRPAGRAVTGG
ncbi:hypothetical protein J7W19_29970 [Streptomyces mobaraensis NBRC 13819 = DSM 40847]|uniref:Uncharacterized protein n=1 Tax=Streptomyces mobaraensis (strain ATCC 29032 / DSM 40847 / JCM 4168 / NBRC 13819 / NCIMB 11159 / IPCR 16-22) TaxID=1223523 RepID=M3CCJ3_STRM1|nr:hypothetical protein [Streptomyces mobaraensis]EMF01711.1 hypothetical protein H340_04894 [Streptomyces mobaraensis NBRC 13819 = DSM 40847]QTT77049.1 hypothetical protein J7W19_29970 [Streptomyces mobaraensis NBRC 13819 = DSM 40847]